MDVKACNTEHNAYFHAPKWLRHDRYYVHTKKTARNALIQRAQRYCAKCMQQSKVRTHKVEGSVFKGRMEMQKPPWKRVCKSPPGWPCVGCRRCRKGQCP
eukprot:scaffold49944_cov19-Tisochrysis_lutea.AAC.1